MGGSPRVLMISSEVESFARTGGLGDVVEALSLALAELGADVVVVTPRYGVTRVPPDARRWPAPVPARYGWGPGDVRPIGVLEPPAHRSPSGGSRRMCLLDDPPLFDRGGIYGDERGPFGDNARRFAVMSRGALELSSRIWPGGPDVVHAHDWHAAFAVVYARLVMGERWARTPSVFTIHNLQFQGVLPPEAVDLLHLPRAIFRPEILWHDGQVNLMKGATALADRVTTVSPTYAREIRTPEGGFGLDLHLRAHAGKITGIVNGIDTARWDPRTDEAIAARYDERTAREGRAACKAALAEELGLAPSDGPIFGAVQRLAWQKGVDLLLALAPALCDRGARLVLVGTGDRDLEEAIAAAARARPGQIAARIAFDPALSRRVYAGADFFVIPSRFEPCGLTQMYAMRYGAIPVATDVGGLHDTIEPIARAGGEGSGTGILARSASVPALSDALSEALRLYDDRAAYERAAVRAMERSGGFAWPAAARRYLALYREAAASRPRAPA